VQDPVPTWCKILLETSFVDRFLIIELRGKDSSKWNAGLKEICQSRSHLCYHYRSVKVKEGDEEQ